MRIDDPNKTNVGASGLTQARQAEQTERAEHQQARKATPSRSGETGPDHVQLSSLAETVKAADPSSAERAARLNQLSAEVASGRYRADADAVADAMISEGTVPRREK